MDANTVYSVLVYGSLKTLFMFTFIHKQDKVTTMNSIILISIVLGNFVSVQTINMYVRQDNAVFPKLRLRKFSKLAKNFDH